MQTSEKLSLSEVFGLRPLGKRLSETALMLRGDEYTPKSRFGLSSLRILKPQLSIRTYLGGRRTDRRIPISSLFNHTPTPIENGWSVRVTQVRDFRNGTDTYDSHNGTDFVVPPGTVVVAPAPGLVVRVANEFHRGGLKVFIDHGGGVMTTCNHLGRALVSNGQRVSRSQAIALSGSSGVDCVAAFPWSAPHVHLNVWLDGSNVDPYAVGDEPSLWRKHNDPVPHRGGDVDEDFVATEWDEAAIATAIAACRDAHLARALQQQPDHIQSVEVLFNLNYFPTRFEGKHMLYQETHTRRPLLDLPFRADDFVGVALPGQ